MSCSAGKGIFLKKIHEWVLVPMSLDLKLLNLNGRLPPPPATMKVKKAKESLQGTGCVRKWTRKLFLLWVFVVFAFGWLWFSLDFSQEDEEAQTLNKYFNVSNNQLLGLASVFSDSDQIVSLECTTISRLLPGDGISCSVKVVRSGEDRHDSHVENARGNECPVHNRGLPLLKTRFVSHVSQFAISATNQVFGKVQCLAMLADSASFQCRNFCDWITGYWWVLAGVALGYKIASKLWMNKHEPAPEHSNGWPQKIEHDQPLTRYQKPVFEPQLRIPPNGSGYWRKRFLILFIVLGVTSSVGLFRHFNAEYNTLREETLANMCDERARMLQDQFNASMNHVHTLAILVSTFHHGKHPSAVDQKTFGEYTKRTDFERPLTSGVAYALKVVHSEREQFEKERGWTIKKMETEDQTPVQDCIPENLDPAPAQDEYAPVIFSQETVSHIVSIDMMSGKEDRDNILRARATGKGVLTSPFKLLKSNHLGVVLTFAVYNNDLPLDATPDQRMEATMGYLGASYDVPSLVEKLLHQLASKETIVVNVYDTTNASSPINMYGTEFTDTGLLHVSGLDFGDPLRRHEMHCRFKQKPRLPMPAVWSSGGLFTITFLVSYIIYDTIRRLAEMEADYHTMADLKGRAEAADVAKSQFLATVSHEIRTPMNGVLGMLQMLMDTELDATQQDYAQTAHASGKELISLMNEVLDQAKIEAGRLELEDVSFDLRAVLDNVQSLFSGKANEKGIELALYVSSRVPDVVIGDPGRFRQIITNLVGNSIKFTSDRGHVFVTVYLADEVKSSSEATDEILKLGLDSVGGGTLNKTYSTLSGYPVVNRWGSWKDFKHLRPTSSDESDRVKLLVTVEDTGVGIPQDTQNHIFTPFVQADSSTSRKYGGTGIGLSISKFLVELMGGEIGFVSEPGTGSTFSFTGCLRRGEAGSLETKWQLCDPSISEFRGLKALIIDERTVRAEVTRYHLERLGISVDVASNMESACSFISNRNAASSQLAMALIDKDVWDNEADCSFRSLLQKQRQNGATEATTNSPKIFLLTASITAGERNTLKSTGLVDNVLAKPLRLSVLVACLQEALGNGKKRILNQKKQTTLGTLLREKRILVVDDNVVNRRVAEGALKKYGALVTCVDSGKAALLKLEPPHRFHACFMDLQMPEMDGFEATKRIRSKESEVNKKIASGEVSVEAYGDVAYWHTPILAMTADVVQASNEQCIKCGMDDYVSKPFDEGQLYSAVARFFESG